MRQRLELRQATTVRTSVRRRIVIAGTVTAVSALVALGIFLFSNFGNNNAALAALGSNMGFENGTTEWTAISGTWTANTTASYVRSGSKSLKVTAPNGSDVEIKNTSSTLLTPVTGTNYIVVTAWIKGSNTNGRVKLGVINTLTSAKTYASSYTTITSSGFTKTTAVLAVSNATTYAPLIDAKGQSGTCVVYTDDVMMYNSTSSSEDATAPTSPTAITATCAASVITLNWTNGIDAGSGLGGVLILRQSGAQTADVAVNDQTTYSTSSTTGPTSIGSWSVVYNGVSVSTLIDNPGATGTYTYLIYMRDNAYNYTTYTAAARALVLNGTALSASTTANTSLDGMYVPSGCTLTITSGTVTIRNGSTVNVYGTLVNQDNIVNTAGGIVNMKSGSTYKYDRDGASGYPVINANWESGSTCEITGAKHTLPDGLDQTFHHLKWNCAEQVADMSLPTDLVANGNVDFIESGPGNSTREMELLGDVHIKGNLYCSDNAEILSAPGNNMIFDGTALQTVDLPSTSNVIKKITINNASGVKLLNNIVLDSLCELTAGNFDLNTKTLYTKDNSTIVRDGGTMTNGTLSPNATDNKYNLIYTNACTTGAELTSATTHLNNLTANAGSSNIVLDKTANVNGTLVLTGGKITTGSYEVSVLNTATTAVDIQSTSSYIVGSLRRAIVGTGTYTFPIGSSSNREYAELTFNNLVGVSNIVASFSSTFIGAMPSAATCIVNGTGINTMVNCGFWTMTPDVQPTSGTYDITIKPKGHTNSAATPQRYAIVKRANSSQAWASLGTHNNNTQSETGGVITAKRSGLTSFSDFGAGYGNTVLPITLSAFDAKYDGTNAVEVAWSTSAELNNAYFSLERSSNGTDYEMINEQEGAGTSTSMHEYSYNDENPLPGTSYYRLKQIDFDGTSTYSPIRVVSVGTNSTNTEIQQPDITVYPNPGQGIFNFNNVETSGTETKATVKIFDVKGQLIVQQTFGEGEPVRIDLLAHPPGVYMATVIDANNQSTSKQLIIQR